MVQTLAPHGGIFHQLSVIAKFALLGAVIAGVTMAWFDLAHLETYRAIGALIGSSAAIITGAYRTF